MRSYESGGGHDVAEGSYSSYLYMAHEGSRDMLRMTQLGGKALSLSARAGIDMARRFGARPEYLDRAEAILAANEIVSERLVRDYKKPAFGLADTEIDGQRVAVREVVVQDDAFGSLLHFQRETDRSDPPVLLVAPMSGHYATLLRGTVEELLPSHDVYITDWRNAREVPLEEGDFGLADYTDYVADYIKKLGPDTNIVAVCQATIPTVAAVSHLADVEPAAQPATMTLMAGPLDTKAAATEVTEFADGASIEDIRRNLITVVPDEYPGAGRMVYPGFVQLNNFMAMNPKKHADAHRKLYRSHVDSRHDPSSQETARKIEEFYDEYFAVSDLPARFYLDTVQQVFKDRQLAEGTMKHRGRLLRPELIDKPAVLTVEGSKDDISAPGQTVAVHSWLDGLDPARRFHYLQEDAGHYGVFNGRHWSQEISPRIAALIRETAEGQGRIYDLPARHTISPERWIQTA